MVLPSSFTMFKDLNKLICNVTLKRYYSIKANKTPVDIDVASVPFWTHLLRNRLFRIFVNCGTSMKMMTWLPGSNILIRPPILHTTFIPKSVFNPIHAKGPYLETFYQVVYSELTNLGISEASRTTSSYGQPHSPGTSSFKILGQNPNIIIKPEDKGGGMALQKKIRFDKGRTPFFWFHYLWQTQRWLPYPNLPRNQIK